MRCRPRRVVYTRAEGCCAAENVFHVCVTAVVLIRTTTNGTEPSPLFNSLVAHMRRRGIVRRIGERVISVGCVCARARFVFTIRIHRVRVRSVLLLGITTTLCCREPKRILTGDLLSQVMGGVRAYVHIRSCSVRRRCGARFVYRDLIPSAVVVRCAPASCVCGRTAWCTIKNGIVR